MKCKNCGKEIPEGSVFCAHCGCDLRKPTHSNHSKKSDEQIPLMLLINQIVKHKIAVLISVVIVGVAIGSYIKIKKHQEKKKFETALMAEIEHIFDIVGTYKNDDITLILSADNTATINYYKNGYGYNEVTRRGNWREKYNGGPIEIEFSKSLEDIYIGNEKHYYCSTLYFIDNRLWESMSAIRSQDYSASEYLSKQ